MTVCIGIDVSKHALEWSVGSEGRIQHTRNEPRPIAQLVRRLAALDAERIEEQVILEGALPQKL